MSFKNLFLFILFFSGSSLLAQDAIIHRNYTLSNSSSIVKSSNNTPKAAIGYNENMMKSIINELKQQLKSNPDNYSLYANLADIYIRSKQYDLALDNFAYLYKQKLNSLLDNETNNIIEKLYSSYIRISRKDSGLFLNLAVIDLILDSKHAIDFAINGAELSNNDELTKKALDIVYSSNQDPVKVISMCEKILARNPNDVEVRKIKAVYHEKLNQKKDAIGEYVKILQTDNSDDNSRYSLYKLLLQFNNSDDKEMLKRLYGMMPSFDYEQAYISLVGLLLKHGDFRDAKYYATSMLKKYDQNPNAYILLAEIYQRNGNIKEAYDTLSKARDKADDNETISKYNVMLAKLSDEPVREANSLIANGLYEQALEVLDSANPEALYVILTKARTYYLLNNKQKTFDLLNQAMSLFNDNSDVYCAFGYIYLQEKDTETARNYVDKSLKLDKNNKTAKDLLDMINKVEGEQYTSGILDAIEAQNYSEAMRLVNEAMSVDKKSADLYYYKSLIYIALNNYSASTSTLYKCIDLDKNYKEAYFYLGVAFDNLNETKNAFEYYKKFIEMTNGNEIGEAERINLAKTRLNMLKVE